MFQTELPKPQKTQKFTDGFDLEVFLSDNWFYVLIVIIILALVIFEASRKKKAREEARRNRED